MHVFARACARARVCGVFASLFDYAHVCVQVCACLCAMMRLMFNIAMLHSYSMSDGYL